jgi:choline dehydrogenase-like flavoprotein
MIGAGQLWPIVSAWGDGIAAGLAKNAPRSRKTGSAARKISILCLCQVLCALMMCGPQDMKRNLPEIAGRRRFAGHKNLNLGRRSHLFPPGAAIHETGGARMGDKPDNSVLNSHCQCWDAENVFVTDGACFVSSGFQNPALTMMALTARACQFIVRDYAKCVN